MKCIAELFGDDRNVRKMIAWGRRIGCADAGHVFDANRRKVASRLVVDDANPAQKSYLLELVDNPAGVRAIPSSRQDKGPGASSDFVFNKSPSRVDRAFGII